MPIIVQKYGGSSVADVEKIRRVAERVKERKDAGHALVVVVSAMGDTTDELLGLAKQVSSDPPRRELDMLLTCGERIAMALLSMALQELGVPAISFTGSQSGIITDDAHARARIVEVRPLRIHEELDRGKVVIVAGYQGVSRQREVTTLGRGGSDTTAVALAAALGAEACEIYSDVDGVFSADPRLVPDARRLESLSHDEMQELAAGGARVLNAQAVEFAREKGIVIHARSTSGSGAGTRVVQQPEMTSGVRAVSSEMDLLVLSAPPPRWTALLAFLAERKIRLRFTGLQPGGGLGRIVVPLADLHGPEALKAALFAVFGPEIHVEQGLGTVTLIGRAVGEDPRLLRDALAALSKRPFVVHGVHAGALQVTFLISAADLPEAVRLLHGRFVGGEKGTGYFSLEK